MTRVNDEQSMAEPMIGDTWSHMENVNEHDTPPVLMMSSPQADGQIMMISSPAQEKNLPRLKRFDENEKAEKIMSESTADQLSNTGGSSSAQIEDNAKVGDEWKPLSSAAKMNSMLTQEWKHQQKPNHLSNENTQVIRNGMPSQMRQQNPMLAQEWKPNQNHVTDANKHAVDELISEFEQMTGKSGDTMDQDVMQVSMPHYMMMSESSPLLGQQNPMLGQEWKHRPLALEQTSNNFMTQETMLGQEWQHHQQPIHFEQQNPTQMSVNNEPPMLGSPPSAHDVLAAGIGQLFNPHLHNIHDTVSFVFHLYFF